MPHAVEQHGVDRDGVADRKQDREAQHEAADHAGAFERPRRAPRSASHPTTGAADQQQQHELGQRQQDVHRQIDSRQVRREEIGPREQRRVGEHLVREGGERQERIADRRRLRPWPEQQHHRIGQDHRRQQRAPQRRPALGEEHAPRSRLEPAPQRRQQQQQPDIAEQHQPTDPDAHGQADRQSQLRHVGGPGPRQRRQQPHHDVERPDHPHRERDVLRVVEHLPVVIGREAEEERGDEAGARPAELAPQFLHADEAQHADEPVQEMPRLVGAERRHQVRRRGRHVERRAVIDQVEPRQRAQIAEMRQVVIEDADAVPVVRILVPGDAVLVERRHHQQRRHDEQHEGRAVPAEERVGRAPLAARVPRWTHRYETQMPHPASNPATTRSLAKNSAAMARAARLWRG